MNNCEQDTKTSKKKKINVKVGDFVVQRSEITNNILYYFVITKVSDQLCDIFVIWDYNERNLYFVTDVFIDNFNSDKYEFLNV